MGVGGGGSGVAGGGSNSRVGRWKVVVAGGQWFGEADGAGLGLVGLGGGAMLPMAWVTSVQWPG